MILTHHGGASIRASSGETTLVFGPVSKGSKSFKPNNFGADIAFVPLNHPDLNGVEEAGRGEKRPFVIGGPGEYETQGITVAAFPSRSRYGGEERINTIYALTFDGISLLYLGALGETALPSEVLEMDAPDIIVVPIGGEGVLSPPEAHKLVVTLEPKIVLPVLYDKNTLVRFLKEAGSEDTKPIEKLTVKSRDLIGKEGEIVVLSS